MTPESLYECWNCDKCSIKATLGELSNRIDAKRFLLQQLSERKANLEMKLGVKSNGSGVSSSSSSSPSSQSASTMSSSPSSTKTAQETVVQGVGGGERGGAGSATIKKRKKKKSRGVAGDDNNSSLPTTSSMNSTDTTIDKLDTLEGLIEEYGIEIDKEKTILQEKEADRDLLQHALQYNVDRKLVKLTRNGGIILSQQYSTPLLKIII